MKSFFKRGLIALLPAGLTIGTFYFFVSFLYEHIGVRLGTLIVQIVDVVNGDEKPVPQWIVASQGWLGFLLALILTFCVGILMATFLGRPLMRLFEALIKRVPMVNTVYPYAKQFTEFFMAGEKKIEFRAPVAVPFPTREAWSIGFVTGDGLKHLNAATGRRCVTIFIPTAPTPFTGFVLFVPREDVIPLPINTDEALRMIITAGIVTPEHQKVDPSDLGPASFPLPAEIEKIIRKAREP